METDIHQDVQHSARLVIERRKEITQSPTKERNPTEEKLHHQHEKARFQQISGGQV